MFEQIGIEKVPSGVLRRLVATMVEALANRGDPVAQQVMQIIVMMQAMGMSIGDNSEREAENKAKASKPEASPDKPESPQVDIPESILRRIKPSLN